MPTNFPANRNEILQDMQTDFISEIPESDPFLRESWVRAQLSAQSGRSFDIYTQMTEMLKQMFPNTAEGIFARQWGNLKGIDIESAKSAQGFISATGVASTIIPENTLWASKDGIQYGAINQDYTIDTHVVGIESLISSGGIATAETSGIHYYATGMSVTPSGVDQSEYNGTFVITVISPTTYKYDISGSPVSPATGIDMKSTATFVSVEVQAVTEGENTNQDSGAQLTIVSSIPSVDDTVYVQFTELAGGTDAQDDIAYRDSYLPAYQKPVTNFNISNIIAVAKTVPGVTRVYVFRITPQIGDVTIFFMRDKDDDPIPTPSEVAEVKNKLIEITSPNTPTESNTDGLIVKAPTPREINFTFSSLTPNTATMHDAILETLGQFFIDSVNVSEIIKSELYISEIQRIVDSSGQSPIFTLSSPAGDIDINFGEIGVLGQITFP